MLGTLSRSAGEGPHNSFSSKLLSRTAGEGGPSPKGSVGEGSAASQQAAVIFSEGVEWERRRLT